MLGTMFVPPPGSDAEGFWVNDIPVFGDFFGVASLPLLDGRVLAATELTGGHHLAVVSERTAARYWPGQRAVGQTLSAPNRKIVATVVGVVAEARVVSQDDDQRGEIYIPAALRSSTRSTFLVRTAGDPELAARDLAAAVRRDLPGVMVRRAESLEMALSNSVSVQRFRGVLFGTAAAAALLLVAVGIAGIVATGVAQRVRELGIRAAIGASRASLTRMMVLDHLRPIAAGAVCGLVASWWAVQFIAAFLYGITPHEPVVWVATTASLLFVGASAAWLPAHRASSADPAIILRAE